MPITPRNRPEFSVPLLFFCLKLTVQLLVAARYGHHSDELYFIECAKHLALGYVDQTPLVPWLVRLCGELAGYGLFGLRLLPALAGATSLALIVVLAREWGGGRAAQLVAGTAALIAPAYLQMASLMHIPVFETLFWTLNAYLMVQIIKHQKPRLWILVGVVAGIGLLNKPTMLLWGLGTFLGLLLSNQRRQLRSVWPWAGAGIAVLMVLPNVIWQQQNEWATLQFVRNVERGVLAAIPRILFLLGQVLYMHPLSILVALCGLGFFFTEVGEPYRLFGWIYLLAFGVFTAAQGKPYYLAPAYPPLFAAGAVLLERRFQQRRVNWLTPSLAALSIGGVLTGAFALPILPLPLADRVISRLLGFIVPDPTMITGDFHREYGWREQAATVATVYRSLPARDQANAVIFTYNYSQASAVNFFGKEWNLPEAFSGQMNYYLWGPPKLDHGVIIAFGMPREALRPICEAPQQVAEVYHPLAVATENHLPVFTCRFEANSLAKIWPTLKRYWH